ncbi:hypothetical protein CLOSTMETH_03928 [[Clostridium] methylpentosum DSM 5476]|uniref:Uncharacterized protein n=1 Tax=[Clostridium] methylpentosum DSM 5476 TaxID=537013 RepID=C0EJ76_9FIRM|nr:hypothetical protein CLOSTMETH_03928 [[Clostridium] methylpentosum DSM 5476]
MITSKSGNGKKFQEISCGFIYFLRTDLGIRKKKRDFRCFCERK